MGHAKAPYNIARFLICDIVPERDPQSVGAAEPEGVEKVTASELAGAEVEQTPTSAAVAVPVEGALAVARLTKSSLGSNSIGNHHNKCRYICKCHAR